MGFLSRCLKAVIPSFTLALCAWAAGFTAGYIESSNSLKKSALNLATNLDKNLGSAEFDGLTLTLESQGGHYRAERDEEIVTNSREFQWSLGDGKHPAEGFVLASYISDTSYCRIALPMDVGTQICFWCASLGTPLLALIFTGSALAIGLYSRRSDSSLNQAVHAIAERTGTELNGQEASSNPDLVISALSEGQKLIDEQTEELKKSQAAISTLLNSLPGALMAIGEGGDVVAANPTGKELLDSITTGAFLKIPAVDSAFRNCLNGESQSSFDLELHSRILSVTATGYSFSSEDKKLKGVVFYAEDDTKSRSMDRAKMNFFAYASHELKSPLTSIIGYLEMIRSGILSSREEVQQGLDESIEQAEEMRGMIRDMLDLSSLESGRERITQVVDLAQVASDCIEALKVQAEKAQVQVIQSLSPLRIQINPQDAERLVRNLLDNAIKYNRKGGYCSISIDPSEGVLEVADTGVGMSKEDASRCFERFYRSAASKTEGSGLGLAIVKHVCVFYGYSVSVVSELGKGSTFRVVIPKNLILD